MLRLSVLLLFAALALPATAQNVSVNDDWCDRGTYSRDGNDEPIYCEVRTVTLASGGTLRATANPNGGIHLEGWSREEVQVRARVRARGRTNAAAKALAERVVIRTDGTIRAETPEVSRREWVAVSFRIKAPHRSNLDLTANNGGIQIEDVTGEIRFETLNGGVSLKGLGGDVQGHTMNGGLSVRLSGRTWDGERLDVSTTNGGVNLDIPRGYSAEVETGTTNGRVRHNLSGVASGDRRQRRQIRTTLGDGGPLVRVRTTNGGVSIDAD